MTTTMANYNNLQTGRRLRRGHGIGWVLLPILSQFLFAGTVGADEPFEAEIRSSVESQTGSSPASASGRQAPRIYFQEDFLDESFRENGWEADDGVRLSSSASDCEPGDDAICLLTDSGKSTGTVELRSRAIDLATIPGAEFTYTIQQRDCEIGEQLTVEYLDMDGRWIVLDGIRSDGRDTSYLTRRTIILPVEALHDGFQFRFLAEANDANDTWRIGQVIVRAYEPLRTLTLWFDPAQPADVDVVLSGRMDGMAMRGPFTRRFPTGARVFLIAPPTVGDNIFSHWTVDKRRETRRVLTADLAEDLDVCAHYAPWKPGRNGATVTLLARPYSDVRIKLGYEPGQWLIEIPTDTEIPALTGEWILLLAPERTPRLVFERWNVNGDKGRDGETLLEHRIERADVLTAEYVLLGDMNGDGALDKYDVDLFIAALIDPEGYSQMYPGLNREQRADINGDGICDTLDLEAFVDLLTAE